MSFARVVLRPGRARPFFGRHPWVYAGAVAAVEGAAADGDEVEVYSEGGTFIGRGLFNSKSRIRVRLYSWGLDEPLDRDFFRRRLEAAVALRRDVLGLVGPGKACRLVFSEGDGLSGMTADLYDRWLVLQFTGLGLAQRREMLADILRELVHPQGVYLRTERGIGALEGLEIEDGPLWGTPPAGPVVIDEAGVEFLVDLAEGQKTGFYLDQRENRRLAAYYAPGRHVLDCFCYSGGFSLHAARGGAASVIGVDVSEAGLLLAEKNAARNRLDQASFVRSDVFEYLESAAAAGRRFGMIVLDPPKFARAQHAVAAALRGYRRLQSLALRLLEENGILIVCCCSGLIDMAALEQLAAQTAADCRRGLQILERRHQPADHPVAVSCLESSYLKCLVFRAY